jgi:hypothetical protein
MTTHPHLVPRSWKIRAIPLLPLWAHVACYRAKPLLTYQPNKWFKASLLSLNYDKTYFIQFINKSTCTSDVQIMYEDKQIYTTIETKFLGLFISNTVSWKTHIGYIKFKLSSACFAIQSFKPYVLLNTLKMIYSHHFHSIVTYGLLF